MFKLLIDTCVWLDLAKDFRQHALLEALEALIEAEEVSLILPRVVVEEFSRNKARVAADSNRSLSSALKRAKGIVDTLGEGKGKKIALEHLDEIDFRLPQLGESAVGAIGLIEDVFARTEIIETKPELLLKAAQRAIDKRAPFHRQRNGMHDSLLIEIYSEQLAAAAPRVRYVFVSHNIKDFSDPAGDNRTPHPDLNELFTRIKSLYSISLADVLKRVDPELLNDVVIDQEWAPEPRRLGEILNAVDEFTDKVWYGRHGLLREDVETRRIRVVDKESYSHDPANPTLRKDIWDGARRAAKRVEQQYGLDGLRPWDNFEWGMLSGKLSALRWVLGDEWDMLDT